MRGSRGGPGRNVVACMHELLGTPAVIDAPAGKVSKRMLVEPPGRDPRSVAL